MIGIQRIKSGLAKEIFRQELTEIYAKQTQRRDSLNQDTQKILRQLIQQMQDGTLSNERIEQLMMELSRQLRSTSGKKQYGSHRLLDHNIFNPLELLLLRERNAFWQIVLIRSQNFLPYLVPEVVGGISGGCATRSTVWPSSMRLTGSLLPWRPPRGGRSLGRRSREPGKRGRLLNLIFAFRHHTAVKLSCSGRLVEPPVPFNDLTLRTACPFAVEDRSTTWRMVTNRTTMR